MVVRSRQFGSLVKELRKNRGETQEVLASQVGISLRKLRSIETAEGKKLDIKTVDILAATFELKGLQLEEFYRIAGFATIPEANKPESFSNIKDNLYRGLRLPAFVRDPLYNVFSFNSIFMDLFPFSLQEIENLVKRPGGLNFLRLLFDLLFILSDFEDESRGLDPKTLGELAQETLYTFRVETIKYAQDSRVISLKDALDLQDKKIKKNHRVKALLQKQPIDFQQIWQKINALDYIPVRPNVIHINRGKQYDEKELSFTIIDIPLWHLSTLEDQIMVVFVPADTKTSDIIASATPPDKRLAVTNINIITGEVSTTQI